MVETLTFRPRWLRLTLTALMAIAVVACGSGATAIDPSTLAGTWVGENILMTVTDTGAHLEMPCAPGTLLARLRKTLSAWAARSDAKPALLSLITRRCTPEGSWTPR